MKNLLFAVAIALAFFFMPVKRVSLSRIAPAEVLMVYRQGEALVVETDTGSKGMGSTVENAVERMHETANGDTLLGTVDFLLVDPACAQLLPEMRSFVRSSVRVCQVTEKPELEEAAAFLRIHQPKVTLHSAVWDSDLLPVLQTGEEMKLE